MSKQLYRLQLRYENIGNNCRFPLLQISFLWQLLYTFNTKKMQSFFHTIFFFTLRNICTPAAKFCIVLHSIKKDGSVYCLSTWIQVVPLSLSAHRFPLPQPYLTFQRKNIKKWASIVLCHPYFGCKKKKKTTKEK